MRRRFSAVFIVPVMDGFRRYAHARVITDFKNMADYMKGEPLERILKACEKAKTKTRTTATRLQETPEKISAGKEREARRNDFGLKHKTIASLLIYIVRTKLLRIYIKAGVAVFNLFTV